MRTQRRAGTIAVCVLAAGAAVTTAATTKIWVSDSASDFSSGEARGIAVGIDGSLVLSRSTRRVDGIIVNSSRVGSLYQEMLSNLSIPVVFINNHNPGGFAYSVSIDDVAGARQVTEHLLALGHTRLAYIGDRFGLQSNLDRMAGFQDALERAPQARRPPIIV